MSDALIPIVDREDNIIGYKSRSEVDKGADIYRVCSVWITNDSGQLLLAQRSFSKKIYPGVWDVAVAGTVEKGETYEETAAREAQEELGITESLTKGPKVRIEGKYNIFIQWFFLKTNELAENFKFQESEIEQVKWFSKDELISAMQKDPQSFIVKDMTRWIELFWK